MWVGGVADSQTRSEPLKTPQITQKIRVFFKTPSLKAVAQHFYFLIVQLQVRSEQTVAKQPFCCG